VRIVLTKGSPNDFRGKWSVITRALDIINIWKALDLFSKCYIFYWVRENRIKHFLRMETVDDTQMNIYSLALLGKINCRFRRKVPTTFTNVAFFTKLSFTWWSQIEAPYWLLGLKFFTRAMTLWMYLTKTVRTETLICKFAN